jgi:hypothetical protein
MGQPIIKERTCNPMCLAHMLASHMTLQYFFHDLGHSNKDLAQPANTTLHDYQMPYNV